MRPAPLFGAERGMAGRQSRMQLEQEVGRRPVGAMDDEAPTGAVGLRPDFAAVEIDARKADAIPSTKGTLGGAAPGDA